MYVFILQQIKQETVVHSEVAGTQQVCASDHIVHLFSPLYWSFSVQICQASAQKIFLQIAPLWSGNQHSTLYHLSSYNLFLRQDN